jgi:radical SAM enzyme (TIGR01210 family)
MCDLWVHTLDQRVPRGAIPGQIVAALETLPPARQIKLYNAGSFFDPNAIPPEDDLAIAHAVAGFDRVIVESHPAFLAGAHGERCLRFRDAIAGRLEVAIGLETAKSDVLGRLNKRMTIESFRHAADFLARHDIDLRVFILLKPPFMGDDEVVEWGCRSIDLARECGASVCSVIPTRAGNDAMPPDFRPPTLSMLEKVIEYGLGLRADLKVGSYDDVPSDRRGGPSGPPARTFADLWDVTRFFDCACSLGRAERLRAMNRTQEIVPAVTCWHDR